jgi:ubiquinol-cytochrome c reductase cytochrome c1 subunit
MKQLISIVASLAIGLAALGSANAAGDGIAWDKAPQRGNDLAALQDGAKTFANYCLSCHSAAYVRYNRLQDLGLTEKQIKANLMFATDKVGETMKSSIDPKLAKEWFGGLPPDLSLVARSRSDAHKGKGPDYLYTLLRSYYRDDSKGTGWNNLAYPNIGMPNPLWQLQGTRPVSISEIAVAKKDDKPAGFERVSTSFDANGAATVTKTALDGKTSAHAGEKSYQMGVAAGGSLSALEYDQTVGNLVAYMTWMAEPHKNQRVRIGVWVLLFLCVLTFIAWRLNAAYWKDVK